MMLTETAPPAALDTMTLAECELYRTQIRDSIIAIEQQLAERRPEQHYPAMRDAYFEWRHRATLALKVHRHRIADVGARIRELNLARTEEVRRRNDARKALTKPYTLPAYVSNDPVSLLAAMQAMTRIWQREYEPYTSTEERALLAAVHVFLEGRGA